jgi:hypothetical protein
MEDRLVLLDVDRAEAVHAANVTHAVHDARPLDCRNAGADHRIASNEGRKLRLAHCFAALRSLRDDDVARLGSRIPSDAASAHS